MDANKTSHLDIVSTGKRMVISHSRKFVIFCLVLLTIFSVSSPVFASTTNNYYPGNKVNADLYQAPGSSITGDLNLQSSIATATSIPLPSPNLLTPSNNGVAATTRPMFQWSAVSGATSYTFQLSTSAAFSTLTANVKVTQPFYSVTSDLGRSKIYYWRVKTNGNKSNTWSETFSLTSANPPSVPTLSSPVNGALLTNYQPTVNWNMSGTASYYHIQFANTSSFSTASIVIDDYTAVTHYDLKTPFQANMKYYWHVRSANVQGQYSQWSAYKYFQTPNTAGMPANTPVGPTATKTNIPVGPTATKTNTPVGPTATKTNTPVGPTATKTNIPVGPTATPTNTSVLPTATNTKTQAPPAATLTPVPPTATKTSTPVTPIATSGAPTGKNYYVSTTGSDQNPGSISQPWKTIQKAANTMVGGDTVQIRGGTYKERVLMFYATNSSGLYVTFTNYPGEAVILDGTGIDIQYGQGLFHLERSNYVRISGLTVQHSNGAGIEAFYADHVQIVNNHTYDTVKSGISTWGATNVVVDGNDIALACNAHTNYPASEENISISTGSYNVEVKNNLVHQASNIPDGYSGGEGINIKDGSHDVKIHNNVVHLDERPDGKKSNRLAYGLDAWQNETYNISFYNNVAYNSAYGFVVESEQGGTAHDISVYNNVAYNNSIAGFYIPTWAQNETSLKKNVQFINNTAYNNGAGIFLESVKIENVVIRNNVLSQNVIPIRMGSGIPQAQITSDCNLTSGDPKFVNSAGGDFRLQSGSPAIDTGSPLNAPNSDFGGTSRPRGSGTDMGAYEY